MPPKKHAPRIITMAATKGGVGKTTIGTALAVRIAADGHKVAILDRDPLESSAAWWQRRGQPANPCVLEVESTSEAIGLIEAEGFDYLIVDTPNAIGRLIADAINRADLVIIPTRASAFDLLGIDPVIDLCREYGRPFAFLLNAVHMNWKSTKTAAEFLRGSGHVLGTMVAERAAYVAAVTLGKSGPEYEKDGAAGKEIDALWAEVKQLMGRPIAAKART